MKPGKLNSLEFLYLAEMGWTPQATHIKSAVPTSFILEKLGIAPMVKLGSTAKSSSESYYYYYDYNLDLK